MSGRPTNVAAGIGVLLFTVLATVLVTRPADVPPERPPEQDPAPASPAPPAPHAPPGDPSASAPAAPADRDETRQLVVRIVAGEGGTPIAGASVEVIRQSDTDWARKGETGDSGQVRFVVLPGAYCIRATAPGRNLKMMMTRADSVEWEVPLQPTSVLEGLVLGLGSGDPIEGVTARTGDHEAVSGADGRFTLAGIQERSRSAVSLSGPWHVPQKVWLKEVRPGETIEMEFALFAAGRVSGVVLDADGSPAAGVRVHTDWKLVARTYSPPPKKEGSVALTDSEGRFAIHGVKTANGARVFAAHAGATAGASAPFDLRHRVETTGLVVRLGRRRATTVTVETEDDDAIKEVEALINCGKEDPWAPLPGLPRADPGREFEVGREFTLEGLSGRPFTLYVCADGYRPAVLASADLLPVADLPLRRVRVVLERGGSASGVLLDGEGRPVAGAVIHANRGRAHMRKRIPFSCLHTRTDSRGRFRIGGLEDHEYEVHATGHRIRSNTVTGVRGGAEDVDLRAR